MHPREHVLNESNVKVYYKILPAGQELGQACGLRNMSSWLVTYSYKNMDLFSVLPKV